MLQRTPHDRAVFRLALPALATLIAEPLYILTDTAIVGRIGTDQLAGLALASAVILSGYALFFFLAYGTTASVARLLGEARPTDAARQAIQGLWLALGLGLVVAALTAVAGPALLYGLGGRGAVLTNAEVYLRYSLAGFPAILASLSAVGYLRGRQNTATPLKVAVGTALLNLVIEAVAIFGFCQGIAASATATVIAQWCGALIFIRAIARSTRGLGVAWKPDVPIMRSLLIVGVHLAIRTAALRGTLLLGTAVAAHFGRSELAAYEVAFEIWSFLALALDALAIAAQALVARALGAGDAATAWAIGKRVNELGVLVGTALGLGVLLLRWPLAGLFSADPAVVSLAAFSLIFVAVAQPLNGWVFALDGVLISAGDQRYLARAMPVAFAVFAISALPVWYFNGGLGWLWVALILFMATRLALLQSRFVKRAWLVIS